MKDNKLTRKMNKETFGEYVLRLGYCLDSENLTVAYNAYAQLAQDRKDCDQAIKETLKERDTWWHDKIQLVKRLIQEGKNYQEQHDMNLAHDEWHPELALLWEIALETLKQGTLPEGMVK